MAQAMALVLVFVGRIEEGDLVDGEGWRREDQ